MTAVLHEFVATHRDEILALAVRKMKKMSPQRSDIELASDFDLVVDEIVRALQEHAGLPTTSPLPGKSAAASKHGAQRQRIGYALEKIALDFGTISDTVGELASREGLSFPAHEYQVFNQCIDTLTASALEQFSALSRQQQETNAAQRVGFVAHELRNALASARMSFNALKKGSVGINSKTGAILDRGLSRLDTLINQMVLSVQLQSGAKPTLKRTSVREFLRQVEDAAVLERDISIGLAVEAEAEAVLEVDADERLLFSALSNLLQNAVKFTKSGGHVFLRALPEEGHVLIQVEDECGGLPPGKAEELFEPYVQRGEDRRGLGLGLAITREAIHLQGGELFVRNLPGKGCVFAVRLPSPRT